MSSHHIVKDFQEPTLVIADGEMCDQSLLFSLLEWSPMVVVLDGAMEKVKHLGFKIDFWIGDFDDFDPEEQLEKLQQDSIQIIKMPDQDFTDLEKAFKFLKSKNAKAVNLVGATGMRMDHEISNYSTVAKYADEFNIVIWNTWSKAFFITSGFEKWYPAKSIISLLPLSEATGIVTTGLHYPLNKEDLKFGERTGSSNHTDQDGLVSIHFQSGRLLLVENLH